MRVLYERRSPKVRKADSCRCGASVGAGRRHSMLYWLYVDRNSWLWRVRRGLWLRSAGYRCERCSARTNLTIHHKTYARLGRERREDVQVLCWRCHQVEDAWRHAGVPVRGDGK
jgi:5-methylcytosine-specific restriction endonuclease McrA